MARTSVPYIDLSVLPEVRPHVLSPRAAVIFSKDLQQVIWTNGEGTDLLAVPAAGGPVANIPVAQRSTIRQITMAVEQLDDEETASAAMRIRSGFKTKLLAFTVSTLNIPGGDDAVLLVTDSLHGRFPKFEPMAQSLADALGKDSQGAAVFDDKGNLLGASGNFADYKISSEFLGELAAEVATEDDLLIKRLVDTAKGEYPAGIAHLSSDPIHNLIVLAAPETKTAKVPVKKPATKAKKPKKVEAAPAEEETPPANTVGAFSSKRIKLGEAGPGKWYYKQQPVSEAAPEPEDIPAASEAPIEAETKKVAAPKKKPAPKRAKTTSKAKSKADDKEKTAKPVRKISSKKPPLPKKKVKKAEPEPSQSAGGLVQTIEHTPIPTGDKVAIAEDQSHQIGNTAEEYSDDGFRFTAGAKPVRFIWEMDADTLFTSVSEEFSNAVGPKTANIAGLNWREVCTIYSLEEEEEIAAILDQGDTWSGKTVLWPVQGTDLRVPIDLAGLPSFGRNRGFAGFNGFGIVRTSDAVVDPEATGMKFGPSYAYEAPTTDAKKPAKPKNASGDKTLSADEKEVFHEIGETLGDGGGDVSPPAETEKAPKIVPHAAAAVPEHKPKPVQKTDPEQPIEVDGKPIVPSAFVSKKIRTPEHDVDTSILSRLPIPVLVYRDSDLLFSNREFSKLTGYGSIQSLADAGGVDALFGSKFGGDVDESVSIFHQDGSKLDVHANLQRVPWDEDRAMLLTLRRQGPDDRPGGEDRPNNGNGDVVTSGSSPSAIRPVPASPNAPSQSEKPSRAKPISNNVTPLRPADINTSNSFGGLNNEELRNILDTASDGVVVVSTGGSIMALNQSAEALFDTDSDSVVETQFTSLFAPESHKIVKDYLTATAGSGVASLLNDGREVIGQTAQGGMIPLSMTLGQLTDQTACCAIFRDMTHWKKVEGELIAARQEAENSSDKKSDFLAKVSHEVRTPLNAIIGFSEIMIEERFGEIGNERYRGYLRDINRSGNHVLELINDLLDISKIEAGEIDLEFDACDLNTIVSETVALSQPQANKQRIIIRTSLSTMVPKVVADPRSLRQIILNLVTNGIKFTNSGGQVIVSTVYDENGEVVLRVRDTGVGMSREDIEIALKPFTQLHTVPETHTAGTGLGLPLTKALVEANRANFHIESTVNEGTLVEIYFPSQRVLADR